MGKLEVLSAFVLILRIGMMYWVYVLKPAEKPAKESSGSGTSESMPAFSYSRALLESDTSHQSYGIAMFMMRLSGLGLLVLIPSALCAVLMQQAGAGEVVTEQVSVGVLLLLIAFVILQAIRSR